jgi:hypothetical protein
MFDHAASAPFAQELLEIEQEAQDFQRRVDAAGPSGKTMMRRPALDATMAKSSRSVATRPKRRSFWFERPS